MSSTRLPGKVLIPILGKPMLALQIKRVLEAREISDLVIATSDQPDDDPIEKLCNLMNVHCFRGSLENVLDRFYRAAVKFSASSIVRLTGDCPLADPNIIDCAIKLHSRESLDYVSNTIERTWPQGLDVEVMRFDILERVWNRAALPSELEHVTLHITNNQENYSIGHLRNEKGDYSRFRWTVDQGEDLLLVKMVYEALYPGNELFNTDDVLDLIDQRPELGRINADVDRRAGLNKSYANDREFLSGRIN